MLYCNSRETQYQELGTAFDDDDHDDDDGYDGGDKPPGGGGGGVAGDPADSDSSDSDASDHNRGGDDDGPCGKKDDGKPGKASDKVGKGASKTPKLLKQWFGRRMLVHFKKHCKKNVVCSAKFKRLDLNEMFGANLLRQSIEPSRSLPDELVADMNVHPDKYEHLLLALEVYQAQSLPASCDVGMDFHIENELPLWMQLQHRSNTAQGYVFFRLIHKNAAAVDATEEVSSKVKMYGPNHVVLEVLPCIGNDPVGHKMLLGAEGTLFTIDLSKLFEKAIFVLMWQTETAEASFSAAIANTSLPREMCFSMCLVFGSLLQEQMQFKNGQQATPAVHFYRDNLNDLAALKELEKLSLAKCVSEPDAVNPFFAFQVTEKGCDEVLGALAVCAGASLKRSAMCNKPAEMTIVDCLVVLRDSGWSAVEAEGARLLTLPKRKTLATCGHGPQDFFLDQPGASPTLDNKTQWYLRALVHVVQNKPTVPCLHFSNASYYRQYVGLKVKRRMKDCIKLRLNTNTTKDKEKVYTKRPEQGPSQHAFQWGPFRFTYR